MKESFLVSAIVAIALGLGQNTLAQTPVCIAIDNEITGDGSWEVCGEGGGETRMGNLGPIGSVSTTDIIYDYFHYVDVGADGAAFRISTTATTPTPVRSGQNQLTSTGQFQGEKGHIILG